MSKKGKSIVRYALSFNDITFNQSWNTLLIEHIFARASLKNPEKAIKLRITIEQIGGGR